jgi:hypothetical protein
MPDTLATDRRDQDGAVYGALAELPGPEALVLACRRLRDEGFRHWDAHSPFPIHGLEKAMGLKRSPVPLFVLVLGLGGAGLGMLLQWWVSVEAYPLVVSGKPLFSWQAFVPIMFECGVLGGALGALFGFLVMARLPRHHHPLFESPAFERMGDDAFFISVEARDERFDRSATLDLLADLGASRVELVHVPSASTEPVTAGGRA